MATTTKEYAVIRTDDYYGPKTTHMMIGMPTEDMGAALSLLDQFAPAGRVELSHNQVSTNVDVWEAERTIDPSDWGTWPQDLEDAACELLRSLGIDPDDAEAVQQADFDVPSESAQKIGKCVVWDDGMRDCYLCKPLADA